MVELLVTRVDWAVDKIEFAVRRSKMELNTGPPGFDRCTDWPGTDSLS